MIIRNIRNSLSLSSLSSLSSNISKVRYFSSSSKPPPPLSSSNLNNDNYDSSKDLTICQYSGLPALNQYIDDNKNDNKNDNKTDILSIDSDDNLQGHWKSLESRVQKRKIRQKGLGGPEGRSTVRVTGWDAEHV